MKKAIIWLVTTLVCTVFFASFWFPIKVAVKKEALVEKEYLICEQASSTGFEWIAVEGSYNYLGYVKLMGNIPLEEYRNFLPSIRFNRFICFGKVISEDIFDGYKSLVFEVEHWEILYPVYRDSIIPEFLQPKYGITVWDTIN